MESTIENFINFCDEMKITNESSIIQKFKNYIKKKRENDKTNKNSLLKSNATYYYNLSFSNLGDATSVSNGYWNYDISSCLDLATKIITNGLSEYEPPSNKLYIDTSASSAINNQIYIYRTDEKYTSRPTGNIKCSLIDSGKLSDVCKNHNIEIKSINSNYSKNKKILEAIIKDAKVIFKNIEGVAIFDLNYIIQNDELEVNNILFSGGSNSISIANLDLYEMNGNCPDDKIDEANEWAENVCLLVKELQKKYPDVTIEDDWDKLEGYIYVEFEYQF